MPAMARPGGTCCSAALLSRASPLPQGVGLGRALSGCPLIGGSGLARDGQTWTYLLHHGALIASKPAPTGGWAWQRIEWAHHNRWERACLRCPELDVPVAPRRSYASKPAPTGGWAWQRIEWAHHNRWERACSRCPELDVPVAPRRSYREQARSHRGLGLAED